jgi:hypothetical protein
MVTVVYAGYRKLALFTECHYAECRYSECRGIVIYALDNTECLSLYETP